MGIYKTYFLEEFDSTGNAKFSIKDYSKLKFGSDEVARRFGYEMAEDFFSLFSPELIANQCMVIPSPYNYVQNAATVLTRHFVDKLNERLVTETGKHVDYSVIARKVSYTSDYGFMSKEDRAALISNDKFYVNKEYTRDKLLIFVDDVFITGTHERKLIEIMKHEGMENDAIFVYFAKYTGNDPKIESQINLAAISSPADFIELTFQPRHHMIVRPIKYVLSLDNKELVEVLQELRVADQMQDIISGALGEGYYAVPKYTENFNTILRERNRRLERL